MPTFLLLLVDLKLVPPLQPEGVDDGARQPQRLAGVPVGPQGVHPGTSSREGFTQPERVALRVEAWLVTPGAACEAGARGVGGQDPLQVTVLPVQCPGPQGSAEHRVM